MKAKCPECDRFIGAQRECPYCACDSVPARHLWSLRLCSLVMAVISLAFLVLLSFSKDIPKVRSGRVNPMMNYARVRAEGVVANNAYLHSRGDVVDYLSFNIDDGTGTLRVSAYSDSARQMASSGKLPKKGDKLEVTGSLRVLSGKTPTLCIDADGVRWRR